MKLFILIICLTGIKLTLACTCFPQHPQNQFCDSKFVIKAIPIKSVVVKEGPEIVPFEDWGFDDFNDIMYTVKILKVFKGSEIEGLERGKKIDIYTAGSSAACGIRLMQDNKDKKAWVLSGYISEQKLRINSCNFIRVWKSLSRGQKRGLNGKYGGRGGMNCKMCKIENCSGGFGQNCDSKKDAKTCRYNENQSCYETKAFCRLNAYGSRCSWGGAKTCKPNKYITA